MPEGSVVVEPGDERMNEGRVSIATRTEGRKGWSDVFEVRMGEDLGGMDMGCVLPGRLGDLCWLDRDGDGLQNWSEEGIPHVRIELLRNGELVMGTESDQYGFYRFSDIYPAVYTLRVYAPAEVKPTVHRTDIPLISSVLEESEDEIVYSVELKVESDKANYNADLGFVCRTPGVEPEGIGQGKKQDWTKIDGSDY